MRGVVLFTLMMVLLSATASASSLSEELSSDIGVKDIDNGDVFNKINDSFLVITKDDVNTFNVESSLKFDYVGDVSKTGEWEYKQIGGFSYEILRSNKKIIRKGDLLCIDKPIKEGGNYGGVWTPEIYKYSCIYYPSQRYNISREKGLTLWKDNRTFIKVSDYEYLINFSLPYDPTSMYTIEAGSCMDSKTECDGTVYGPGGIIPQGDDSVNFNIIFYENTPYDIGYYNFSTAVTAGALTETSITYAGVTHNASSFDISDTVTINDNGMAEASEPGWTYTLIAMGNAEQQVGSNEQLWENINGNYGSRIYGSATAGPYYTGNGSSQSNEGVNNFKSNYETYCFAIAVQGKNYDYFKNGTDIGGDNEESVDRLVSDGTDYKLGNEDSNETFVRHTWLNYSIDVVEQSRWCNSTYGCNFQTEANFTTEFNLSGNNMGNVSLVCLNNNGDTDCCFTVSGNTTEYCGDTDNIILDDGNDRNVTVTLKTNNSCDIPILTSITLKTWNSSVEEPGSSNYCSCEPGADVYINFTAGCHYNATCYNPGFDCLEYGTGTATINGTWTCDNFLSNFTQTLNLGSNASINISG